MSYISPEELKKVFFEDPRWESVEKLLTDKIDELLDLSTVDTTKDSDAVRAEVIGRKLSHDLLYQFLQDTKFIRQKGVQHAPNNPFK